MKYVYVATMIDGAVVAVTRKRKAMRKALERNWAHNGRTDPLIWKDDDWAPWRYMGTKLVPTPYRVEKIGVE